MALDMTSEYIMPVPRLLAAAAKKIADFLVNFAAAPAAKHECLRGNLPIPTLKAAFT